MPTRRDFIKQVGAGAAAAAGTVATSERLRASPQSKTMARGRVIGANDRINVGFVGCGGRMNTHIRRIMERNKERGDVQAVAVNDIWDKRKQRAREATGVDEKSVHHDYREVCARSGRRRRRHRLARSLAPRADDGGAPERQGRLSREADDLHGRGGERDRRRRQGRAAACSRSEASTRSMDHFWKATQGDQGRSPRRGRVGVRRLRPQPQSARRVELRHRPRRHREDPRLEGVSRPGAEAAVRSRALLPLAQVLGLLGRHRDGPLLPLGLAAAASPSAASSRSGSPRRAASTCRRTARYPIRSS